MPHAPAVGFEGPGPIYNVDKLPHWVDKPATSWGKSTVFCSLGEAMIGLIHLPLPEPDTCVSFADPAICTKMWRLISSGQSKAQRSRAAIEGGNPGPGSPSDPAAAHMRRTLACCFQRA